METKKFLCYTDDIFLKGALRFDTYEFYDE